MAATRLWLAFPLALLTLVVALLLVWRPLDRLSATAPPVENASVESVRLTPGMISLSVRTDGSEPVVFAQVQVDGCLSHLYSDARGPGRLARSHPY